MGLFIIQLLSMHHHAGLHELNDKLKNLYIYFKDH